MRKKTDLFLEQCGLNLEPKQSSWSRSGVAATRHWLQLMSLATLLVAVAGNSVVTWYLLPHRLAVLHPRWFFRAWAWSDEKFSLYGWVPLALWLLAWEYFIWRNSKPKIRNWVTRKLLTFALLAGIAPVIPSWVPAGQPSQGFLSALAAHPGLPASLSWGVVVFVITLLCLRPETRDSLLGRGRVLSLVSLGAIFLLLTLTIVGWSLT